LATKKKKKKPFNLEKALGDSGSGGEKKEDDGKDEDLPQPAGDDADLENLNFAGKKKKKNLGVKKLDDDDLDQGKGDFVILVICSQNPSFKVIDPYID
jgi:hypothetical protein